MNKWNRFENALHISCGACNPSGIAYSLIEACTEVRNEHGDVCNDPAIRLIVYQLAFITGVTSGINEMYRSDYFADTQACRSAIALNERQGEFAV